MLLAAGQQGLNADWGMEIPMDWVCACLLFFLYPSIKRKNLDLATVTYIHTKYSANSALSKIMEGVLCFSLYFSLLLPKHLA